MQLEQTFELPFRASGCRLQDPPMLVSACRAHRSPAALEQPPRIRAYAEAGADCLEFFRPGGSYL